MIKGPTIAVVVVKELKPPESSLDRCDTSYVRADKVQCDKKIRKDTKYWLDYEAFQWQEPKRLRTQVALRQP